MKRWEILYCNIQSDFQIEMSYWFASYPSKLRSLLHNQLKQESMGLHNEITANELRGKCQPQKGQDFGPHNVLGGIGYLIKKCALYNDPI